jgi:hypothetical protein
MCRIRHEWICYFVMIAANIGFAGAARVHLGIERDKQSDKPLFTLNGAPWYPVVYSLPFPDAKSEAIRPLPAKGFNTILISTDTEDVATPRMKQILDTCRDAELPVIVELNAWSFNGVLKNHPELNMVMKGGQPVRYFPDYANPESRRQYLSRYQRAAAALKAFENSPVVAISVGAYDGYHLPDGEVHADFTVPAHHQLFETGLPYGAFAEQTFEHYLDARGIRHSKNLRLPTTPEDAESAEIWRRWILFRRELVKGWLADTIKSVRSELHLPVTVTFDMKFAQNEDFATPPAGWIDLVDFLTIYSYGRTPVEQYLPADLCTLARSCKRAGVPIVALLEFSSALGGTTPADAYARYAAPFVSGMECSAPWPQHRHDAARVDTFIRWINQTTPKALRRMSWPPASILILVDPQAIYFRNAFAPSLNDRGIAYETETLDRRIPEDLNRFNVVLVSDGISDQAAQPYSTGRRMIREAGFADYLNELSPPRASAVPASNALQPILDDSFQSLKNWHVTLNNEAYRLSNCILSIDKENLNTRGLATRATVSPPYTIEMDMAFQPGKSAYFSLLDATKYPISPTGGDPARAANELSFGAIAASSREMQFGINTGEWRPLWNIVAGRRYRIRCAIDRLDQQKDVCDLEIEPIEATGEISPPMRTTLSIPRREVDRLWLLWAYDRGAADVYRVAIHAAAPAIRVLPGAEH